MKISHLHTDPPTSTQHPSPEALFLSSFCPRSSVATATGTGLTIGLSREAECSLSRFFLLQIPGNELTILKNGIVDVQRDQQCELLKYGELISQTSLRVDRARSPMASTCLPGGLDLESMST